MLDIKRIREDYEGVISGVTHYGIYVELDNTIEGKIYNNSGTLVTYTQEEMKGDEVITILNEGNQNSIYKKDLNNINEEYPVFEWQ